MGLIDTALEDNKVSKAEREEIERIATWLGVDTSDWTAMVKAARAEVKGRVQAFRDEMAGGSVAFSGSGIYKPNIREALAAKHTFAYSTRVSESTDLLVIGSEQIETRQVDMARKARHPRFGQDDVLAPTRRGVTAPGSPRPSLATYGFTARHPHHAARPLRVEHRHQAHGHLPRPAGRGKTIPDAGGSSRRWRRGRAPGARCPGNHMLSPSRY